MQNKIILASLFAAAASAEHLLAHLPRQTDSSGSGVGDFSEACISDLQAAQASNAPTPDAALVESIATAVAAASDPCKFKPTGALSASLASYNKEASSWADAHKDIASKIQKDCSVDLASVAEAGASLCSSAVSAESSLSAAESSLSAAATPTSGSGSGSGSGSAASGSASESAGSGASATSGSTSASATTSSSSKPSSGAASGPVAAGALLAGALGAVIML